MVNEIKEQFTLADVLPSSLECSDRESCSHHSISAANSRNVSASKLPKVDRTIDEDQNANVEMIDEAEDKGISNH